MKTSQTLFALGVVGCLSFTALSARADLEVSVGISIRATADFEAPLASHGTWVSVGSYGRCWRPTGIVSGWRPYCDGTWVWTDCGWYWQSDEPWAWATYHYGNWYLDSSYGWVWVPAIEWAPCWVSWRVGGGYTGWAPLPPRGVTVAIGGPQFVFVQNSGFRQRVHPNTVIVNNTTIINKTTVINNVRRETRNVNGTKREVMVNEGPGTAPVQQASPNQKIETAKITQVAARTQVPEEVRKHSNNAPNRNGSAAPAPGKQAAPDAKTAPPTPNAPANAQPGRQAAPAQPSVAEEQKRTPPAEQPRNRQAQPSQPTPQQPRQAQPDQPRREQPPVDQAKPDQPKRDQPPVERAPEPPRAAPDQPRHTEPVTPPRTPRQSPPSIPPGQQRKADDSYVPPRAAPPAQPTHPSGPPAEQPQQQPRKNEPDDDGRGKGKP